MNLKFSYIKLWKLLLDKGMSKQELRERCGFSSGTATKLNKDLPVSAETLLKICECLNCNIGDICDVGQITSKSGTEDHQ